MIENNNPIEMFTIKCDVEFQPNGLGVSFGIGCNELTKSFMELIKKRKRT